MKHLHFLFILAVAACLTACHVHESHSYQAGTVIRDTLQGTPCCVYLPYRYEDRITEEQTLFPVLYLHHGMFGNEDDWTAKGRLVEIMDSLLHLQQVREMVIIMPDNCPSRDSWQAEHDNATTGAWERNFPAFMAEAEAKYHISSLPAERAIAGLSMGGFHSYHVSHHLAGQFGYVGLFSPYLANPDAPEYADRDNEVRTQLASRPLYWIGIGSEDFLYQEVQEYRRWLEKNHLEYTYYESAGGHDWPNWQDYITRFLPLLF